MKRHWLIEIRKKKKWSQQILADECNITRQLICAIETGNRRPSVKTAKNIAKVLHFDWTMFYSENLEKDPEK